MRPVHLAALAFAAVLLAAACTSPRGATVDDKRAAVLKMRDKTLAELYEANPQLRQKIEQAAGYAVFTNVNLHLLALSGGDGYGVAVSRSGQDTFMRVGSIGGGPGMAMRDFRSVFIFGEQAAFDRFVSSGWQFSLESGASAQSSDRGGSAHVSAQVSGSGDQAATAQTEAAHAATGEGVEVYQLTQAGIALHAVALGTRYFKDSELN